MLKTSWASKLRLSSACKRVPSKRKLCLYGGNQQTWCQTQTSCMTVMHLSWHAFVIADPLMSSCWFVASVPFWLVPIHKTRCRHRPITDLCFLVISFSPAHPDPGWWAQLLIGTASAQSVYASSSTPVATRFSKLNLPDGPKNGTVKVLFVCSFTKLCMRFWDRV